MKSLATLITIFTTQNKGNAFHKFIKQLMIFYSTFKTDMNLKKKDFKIGRYFVNAPTNKQGIHTYLRY